jgi:predicted ABC-type ATPase
MVSSSPKIVVLAGPNGAGKSTSAARLLLGALKVQEFVNADTIAAGLSAFAQDRVAFEAGRIMLMRLKELAAARASFAFETTLASRSYAPWLARLRAAGYQTHVIFLWLPSADEAVARVAGRVRAGGHDVPEPTIRRRYDVGLKNLVQFFLPLADTWQLVDNSLTHAARPIAAGGATGPARVYDLLAWQSILAKIAETMIHVHDYDPETLQQILEEGDAVIAAIRESVREALRMHKRLGLPVVTWQDGKVVWIPADQISVDDDEPPAY